MGSPGFSSQASTIFKEIRSQIEIPFRRGTGVKTDFQTARMKKHKQNESYPVRLVLRHNHFTYRGNRITTLVPELSYIAEEGVIGLAEILMEELKIREGDRVRIITEHGESSKVCRTMNELIGHTALLFPDGIDTLALHGGLVPEIGTLLARIEKA
jgi:anaerobic selenocysteine-containing dehydrogenase